MMTPSQTRERVTTLLAAWNARNLDAFVAQLTPDIYWHDLGMPHPPALGRDAVRLFSETILRAFPDFRYELRGPLCVAEDGMTCVVPFLITATNSGRFDPPGFAPTGQRVQAPGLDYLTFRGEYVARIETRFDPIELMEQLFRLRIRPPAGSLREGLAVQLQRLRAAWLRRGGDN
jgi:predicted ester cyclase